MVDKELEARHQRRETGPGNPRTGMTIIVKTVTRLTVGLIFLFAFYIILHGHLTHGGGFAGGVIIAIGLILFVLAFGRDEVLAIVPRGVLFALQGIGALLFVGLGIAGLFGGSFMKNLPAPGTPFSLFSAGFIPIANLAIALNVGVGLFVIFIVLVGFKAGKMSDKERQ